MENCGIGACATDQATCVGTIINMIKDVITGLIDFISFCVSLGTSSGITASKNAVQKGMSKVGSQGIKAAFNSMKQIFKKKFKDVIESKAKQIAKNLFKEFEQALAGFNLDNVCTEVFKSIENKIESKSNVPSVPDLVKAVDVFEISSIVENCSSNKAVECAKSVLNTAKMFDPTGLLTIATTFVHPSCDVPRSLSLSPDIHYAPDRVNPRCIQFYEYPDFQGRMVEICDEEKNLSKHINDFKSIKASSLSSYAFFSNSELTGNHFILGRGGNITNIDDLSIPNDEGYGINMPDYMASMMRIKEECVGLFYTNKEGKKQRRELCGDTKLDLSLSDIKDLLIEVYSDEVTAVLYEEVTYSGKYIDIKGSVQDTDKDFKLKRLGFIKIDVDYDSFGFLCGYEAETAEIIRMNGENVECLSLDGKNCIKRKMSLQQCVNFVLDNKENIKPITCGLQYQSLYDISGYSTPDHWCVKGMKFFDPDSVKLQLL